MLQLYKFILIGVVNTLFYYSLYALLIYLGFSYIVSVILATLVAMFFSFKTFGKYVFYNEKRNLLLKFLLLTLLNTALNILIIYLLSHLNYTHYTAGAIATVLVAINSFLLNKFFVFK